MPGFRAKYTITRKKGVLDPEGTTIHKAMGKLGYNQIKSLTTGKLFEIIIEAKNEAEARKMLKDIGHNILSNPVIEDATITQIEEI